MAYLPPKDWTAPIRKTWAELKKLTVSRIPIIRAKRKSVSILAETAFRPVRGMRHTSKGRTCSSDGLTNHQRVVKNRKAE